MNLVPSILSDSLTTIQAQLDRIHTETELKRVQIDIVDAEFADEITVSPIDLLDLNLYGLTIDIHLMTNDPINDVVECSQIPGVSLIIGQIEHMPSQSAFIAHVKSFNLKVGLAVDLTTPVEEIETAGMQQLDALQVMDIQAGAQRRPFEGEQALQQILDAKKLIALARPQPIELLVDGGITSATVKLVVAAGVDTAVVGSVLWNAPRLSDVIAALSLTG